MLASKFLSYTCALLISSYVASGHPMTLHKNGLQANRVKEARSPKSLNLLLSDSGEAALGTQQKKRSPKRNAAKQVKPAGPVDNKRKRDEKVVNISEKSILDPKIVLSIG
ncbi:uncharacterized protein MELLADRAFT_64819 [Melampsora larici-populina 98AG31]|uniref:Secreted protein n=1 Tax=Melampsora larici-populina (strain 98AG31 / pathotype 3-4-7) TaxID=747676 RepID=F4RSX4_MELLP|nr:uncharacterized protein MELLADRAFT_64819 [Melampsora larici-populina 98AG31]EGG04528.1 secreted protein [Melampsora larici-populina 98AG31]